MRLTQVRASFGLLPKETAVGQKWCFYSGVSRVDSGCVAGGQWVRTRESRVRAINHTYAHVISVDCCRKCGLSVPRSLGLSVPWFLRATELPSQALRETPRLCKAPALQRLTLHAEVEEDGRRDEGAGDVSFSARSRLHNRGSTINFMRNL